MMSTRLHLRTILSHTHNETLHSRAPPVNDKVEGCEATSQNKILLSLLLDTDPHFYDYKLFIVKT